MNHNISWQSSNFEKWFDLDTVKPKKVDIESKATEKPMTSQQILGELKPQVITQSELAYILDKKLINQNDWYILFVVDTKGITRAVGVRWGGGDGWDVRASGLERDDQWGAGCQAFSRKPFGISDTSLETLSPSVSLSLRQKLEKYKRQDADIVVHNTTAEYQLGELRGWNAALEFVAGIEDELFNKIFNKR